MAKMTDEERIVLNKIKRYVKYGAGGFFALCVITSSYFTVPQTELCYVTQFGKVVDVEKGPIGAGAHLKLPLFQSVDCMQVSRSTDNLGVVSVTTKDSFTFKMRVGVTTEIPSSAVYRLMYQTGKMGSGDISPNINPNIVNTLRNVMGKHELMSIAGESRTQVLGEFQSQVTQMLQQDWGILVQEVQISIEELPPEYNARMNAAQSQQAAIVVARRQQEQSIIEAKTAVIKAEGEANQKAAEADGERRRLEALAEGNAKARILQANAEADATRAIGNAQAEAAAKMADAISKNASLVQLEQAKRWDGKLPVNIYGGAPIPLMNLMSTNK